MRLEISGLRNGVRSLYRSGKQLWFTLIRKLRRSAYRIQCWFNYQHVSALIMFFLGLNLHQRSSPSLEFGLDTLGIGLDSGDAALLFIFATGVLIGSRQRTLVFRFATLPLIVYGGILLWYGTRFSSSLGVVSGIYGVGIWALLQIFGTRAEEDSYDSTGSASST